MQKIISLFQRNYAGNRQVHDEVVPGAEWVLTGEGVATRKFDGACCRVHEGQLEKRYDVKKGRTPPPGFEEAQPPDATTGHWPGWVPVGDGPEDQWFRAGMTGTEPDGTYELVGPKIQGNPEGFAAHTLVRHGGLHLPDCPRTFDTLNVYLADGAIEGVVWHHPDGRMVKIKGRDFGHRRKEVNE